MIPVRSEKIKGPWFSLGFHIDFQRRYVDLHVVWWIITIGRDYYQSHQVSDRASGSRIHNYPDRHTFAYAELWSADRFRLEQNPYWWPRDGSLKAEDKGDELDLGVRYKLDIPAPCWVVYEGTADGVRILMNEAAVSEDELEGSPGSAFLPVYPGVNVIEFTDAPAPQPPDEPAPGPPDEPQPEPEEPTPPVLTAPRIITIYGGGIGNTNRPVVERKGDEFVASVPRADFEALWELIVSRIGEWFGGT